MRALTAAGAALALGCAMLTAAPAQTTVTDAAAAAKKSVATKACTSAADALVWFVPGTKLFFRKGQAGFGKGVGSLVCRHIAIGKHGRAAPTPGPSAEPAEPSAMPHGDSTAMPMPMTTADSSPQPASSAPPTMRP
jgi:hypothetical protein